MGVASGGGDEDGGAVELDALVERKAPELPCFVVVPGRALEAWSLEGTTVVEVVLGDAPIGRRTLKAWPEREGWFFDLTRAHTDRAGLEPGDRVAVRLTRASTELPVELARLLEERSEAREAWEALTPSRRRMLAEHVRGGKRVETRARRAVRSLGLV